MAAKTYSASELASALGVDRGTVLRWVRDGCPATRPEGKSRGTAWSFELPGVVTWLRETAKAEGRSGHKLGTVAQIERAHAEVNLELAELRLGELRGEVLRVDDVLEIVGADYDSLRRMLSSIPARVGPELWALVTNGATEPQTIDALERTIDDVLRGLSGVDTGDRGANGSTQGAALAALNARKAAARPRPRAKRKTKAAAKADAKPVGRSKPTAKRRGKR